MKKEKIVETRVVYVSSDGKQFEYEWECEKYETDLTKKEDARKTVEQLPFFTVADPFPDVDPTYVYYFVQDDAELAAVKSTLFNEDAVANDQKPEKYPLWIRCAYEDDGYGWIESAADHVTEIEDYLYRLNDMLHEKTPDNWRMDAVKYMSSGTLPVT